MNPHASNPHPHLHHFRRNRKWRSKYNATENPFQIIIISAYTETVVLCYRADHPAKEHAEKGMSIADFLRKIETYEEQG